MIRKIYYKCLGIVALGKGIKRNYSGHIIMMPPRYYRYYESDYEKENIRLIDKYVTKGMTIVDVGAHIGLMSAILAQKVGTTGKVYAFEPTPTTFKILMKTIVLNNVKEIVCAENAALSEKTGKAIFYISDNLIDNSNSLVNNERKERKECKIHVHLYSIDDYVSQKGIKDISFIKIDAEGAELQVLKGATKTLQQWHPRMVLGLHPRSIQNFGNSLEEIWDFLQQENYRVEYYSKEMHKQDFISRTDLFDVALS